MSEPAVELSGSDLLIAIDYSVLTFMVFLGPQQTQKVPAVSLWDPRT